MGINHSHAVIARAVKFLAVRQQADGSWEEDTTAAAGAPRWVRPGDVEARLYLTANCGFWLAMSGEHDGATKAAAYLRTCLDENGHMPSFSHTHWLAAGVWYRLNWQEPAERIARHLGQQLTELAASNLAWLIITLRCAGVPARHTLVDEAASLLEQNQHQDGRWPIEDAAADFTSVLEDFGAGFLQNVWAHYSGATDTRLLHRIRVRIKARPLFDAPYALDYGFEERFQRRLLEIEAAFGPTGSG